MRFYPRKLATRAGLQASCLTLLLGVGVQGTLLTFEIATLSWLPFLFLIALTAVAAGLLTSWFVHHMVASRIEQVVDVIQTGADRPSLARLPRLGNDEIGQVASSVNQLLANMTSLEVQVLERDQELQSTKKELSLQAELAEKSAELEQRLRERALLFEVLRASASERDLNAVLHDIANRLGLALRLREFILLLSESESERLVVKAAYSLMSPLRLADRIVLLNEGPLGEVARTKRKIIIDDLSQWDGDELLWELIERKGSFAALPILHRGETIGVMAATRSEANALSEEELHLFGAIADQLALSIRHAQLFDEMRRGSQHDDLTGLANRRLLRERLDDELHRSARFELPTSVIAFDIDHFKLLNDRCGHPTGDASLRKLAGLMTRHLRRIDTIARTGGEEFVVLLPRTNADVAYSVAEKIRNLVESTEFPGGVGQPGGHLTISAGVATLSPKESGKTLIARADAALYEAKNGGRNLVVNAPQPTGELVRSRISSRN